MRHRAGLNMPAAAGSTNMLISIHRHENCSWQGVVQWLDTGQKLHFRSELELLNLMHQAVQSGRGDPELRSWDDAEDARAIGE